MLLIPPLTTVGDGAFLADDTLIGGYELGGGWLRVERVKIGKRAFVGNSGMAAPGRKVPKQALVAVLSAAPRRRQAKAGTSWLGSPPRPLRRERDDGRRRPHLRPAPPAAGRPRPGRALPARAGVAARRCSSLGVVADPARPLLDRRRRGGPCCSAGRCCWSPAWSPPASRRSPSGCSSAGMRAVGAPAVELVRLAQRARRHLRRGGRRAVVRPRRRPARRCSTSGCGRWAPRIGRGVWCETYWLPEADLVDLRDGATVNRGCVVQTHLFHDRIMSMDPVTLATGATLGPNSVILPAATIGRHATVGPVSLVMRGESVPDKTRWIGNPIGPWADARTDA